MKINCRFRSVVMLLLSCTVWLSAGESRKWSIDRSWLKQPLPRLLTLDYQPDHFPVPRLVIPAGPSVPADKTDPEKCPGRVLLWSSAWYLGLSLHYWTTYEAWEEDWDYKLNWEDQSERFFTLNAIRFDSNFFGVNTISHVVQGLLFYNLARTNGYSSGQSLLFNLCSSLLWEYITEYREVISINDNIVSTMCGLSAGEALYHTGIYLNTRQGTIPKILSYLLNPVLALDRAFYSGYPLPGSKILDKDRIEIYLAGVHHPGNSENPETAKNWLIGFTLDLSKNSPEAPAGSWLSETLSTHFSCDVFLGGQGVEEFQIQAKSMFYGYQKREPVNQKDPGFRLLLGAGSAITYLKKRPTDPAEESEDGPRNPRRVWTTDPNFSDKYLIIGIIGPMLDWHIFNPDLNLRLKADLFLDFGLVNSLAFNTFARNHDFQNAKTLLLDWGYYPSWGFTADVCAELDYRGLEFRGDLTYWHHYSIDGRDRFQDLIAIDDFHLRDKRFLWNLSLGYRFPSGWILRLRYEYLHRQGIIKEVSEVMVGKKLYYQLAYQF